METHSRFYRATFFSVAIHAALFAGWQYWPSEKVVVARQVDSMQISLGLQAALAGAAVSKPQAASVAMKAQPQQPKPQPNEPDIETQAETDSKPQSDPIPELVLPSKQATPKSTPQPSDVKAEPKPTKPVKPKQTAKKHQPLDIVKPTKSPNKPLKTEPKPQPTPDSAAHVATASSSGQQGQQGAHVSEQKIASSGQSHQEGGSAEQQFDLLIREHLLSKKRTPKVLRAQRLRGDVTVEFVLSRDGKVLKHKLSEPSRVREFDRAAIKLVKQAEPYPTAPDNLNWQQRVYSIVIRYEIK
ncbi:TonB protein C-terminal [Vibrio xiamenensis]|uniref:TonB protein C-terminal n=1 Tax=Vibrio xiamenensis TaxID=861298 RepID=A0A1G8ETB4_9VIBR|nr:TonB family protein [Vibrio xiamenensis]SDH72969.1 TonB protein C-terminal [Vibrio xiamenensis]